MRNIEIKARAKDLRASEAVARKLTGRSAHARLRQIDTYFRAPVGRLKLREVSGTEKKSELVFYRRENAAGPKRSDYCIAPVIDAGAMKALLTRVFGVLTVVKKKRTAYLYKNVRIHLDKVDGLGNFIEFEAVMKKGASEAEGKKLVAKLMNMFSLAPRDLVGGSYSDLLLRGGR
jgi:predicted adenylyl cyclase CyaB